MAKTKRNPKFVFDEKDYKELKGFAKNYFEYIAYLEKELRVVKKFLKGVLCMIEAYEICKEREKKRKGVDNDKPKG